MDKTIKERLKEKSFKVVDMELADGKKVEIIQEVLINEYGFKLMEVQEYMENLKGD